MKRKTFFLITFCLNLILIIISAEILLRLTGNQPWTYYAIDANEPTMHELDPELGWKNKQGKYTVPAYVPNGKDIKVTFSSDGTRATGPAKLHGINKFIIVGGSVTQGWAISDNETYPWKLQMKIPTLRVLNYGTGGYGTYQSLLVLERIFANLERPVLVLYGFVSHHEIRNVAPSYWLEMLTKFSRRGHVCVPYCTIDNNGLLVRHPPEGYRVWPLSTSLATINFLQRTYMKLKTKRRDFQRRRVTEKLLLQMNNLCKAYDAKFVVALLVVDGKTKSHYIEFFKKNHVKVIDCAYSITPEMQVPGEIHPDAETNTLWANCITEALDYSSK